MRGDALTAVTRSPSSSSKCRNSCTCPQGRQTRRRVRRNASGYTAQGPSRVMRGAASSPRPRRRSVRCKPSRGTSTSCHRGLQRAAGTLHSASCFRTKTPQRRGRQHVRAGASVRAVALAARIRMHFNCRASGGKIATRTPSVDEGDNRQNLCCVRAVELRLRSKARARESAEASD